MSKLNTRIIIKAIIILCGYSILVPSWSENFKHRDPVGGYQGSPFATWSSLRRKGFTVGTFTQTHGKETVLRRYLQYVPKSVYRQSALRPLVIVLTGANTSAEQMREWEFGKGFERLANLESFILVYGNAYSASGEPAPLVSSDPFNANQGYWRGCLAAPNAGPNFFDIDDVDYLKTIVNRIEGDGLPVDLDRVYIVGLSNGGEMAMRAAREMGESIAAVASVVPLHGYPASEIHGECSVQDQQHPLSMMFVYSPKDPFLGPIFESLGWDYGGLMEESVNSWMDALGIDKQTFKKKKLRDYINEGLGYNGNSVAALNSKNSHVVQYDFTTSTTGAKLSLLKMLPVGGHGWPRVLGSSFEDAETFGFRNQDIHTEKKIWAFLKDKTRIDRLSH